MVNHSRYSGLWDAKSDVFSFLSVMLLMYYNIKERAFFFMY